MINISELQTMDNCRFYGTYGTYRTYATYGSHMLLHRPVHLLRVLFQTFLNAAHTPYLPSDAI